MAEDTVPGRPVTARRQAQHGTGLHVTVHPQATGAPRLATTAPLTAPPLTTTIGVVHRLGTTALLMAPQAAIAAPQAVAMRYVHTYIMRTHI
jgi:hypothetical protein